MRKKKTKKRKSSNDKKIIIDQILLKSRQVFLFDVINNETARRLVQELIALDKTKVSPIALYINSPGGSCSDGFAIIDAMKGVRSAVITFVTGEACSMAGLVSVAGDKRVMSQTAIWMSHDMAGGVWGDYTTKVIDRTEHLKRYQAQIFDFLRKHTKLSEEELAGARHGELWLTAEEAKKKGVVDSVVK